MRNVMESRSTGKINIDEIMARGVKEAKDTIEEPFYLQSRIMRAVEQKRVTKPSFNLLLPATAVSFVTICLILFSYVSRKEVQKRIYNQSLILNSNENKNIEGDVLQIKVLNGFPKFQIIALKGNQLENGGEVK